jgi:hypothetical protein
MHREAPMRLDVMDVIHDRRPESGNLLSDAILAEPLADKRALARGGAFAKRSRGRDHLER